MELGHGLRQMLAVQSCRVSSVCSCMCCLITVDLRLQVCNKVLMHEHYLGSLFAQQMKHQGHVLQYSRIAVPQKHPLHHSTGRRCLAAAEGGH